MGFIIYKIIIFYFNKYHIIFNDNSELTIIVFKQNKFNYLTFIICYNFFWPPGLTH